MEPGELARRYYDAIDAGEYQRLAEVLAPDFVQERGDRTLVGRQAFVGFVRDQRPRTDTTHDLHHVVADGDRVVVEGTLRGADGEALFRFADAFAVADGDLQHLRTYSQ